MKYQYWFYHASIPTDERLGKQQTDQFGSTYLNIQEGKEGTSEQILWNSSLLLKFVLKNKLQLFYFLTGTAWRPNSGLLLFFSFLNFNAAAAHTSGATSTETSVGQAAAQSGDSFRGRQFHHWMVVKASCCEHKTILPADFLNKKRDETCFLEITVVYKMIQPTINYTSLT